MLFECLTGSVPFARESQAAVLWAHVNDPVARVTDRRPDVLATLDAVVARGMAKDPAHRYPTAGETIAMVRAAIEPAAATLPARVEQDMSAWARPPSPLTSLIGREEDVERLHALLARPDARLVTLVGSGGVGKTRLAAELARSLGSEFADGARFV